MKNKIKNELFKLADLKYKEFHSGLCPGTENIIGVRVPILRKYAQKLVKENNWLEIINEIDNEYYEEIMLQGMIIGQAKKEDINVVIKYIEEYIPKIDNWAICDTFSAGLKITKKYQKEMWEVIQKHLESEKEFEIRFSIVMILDYYIEEEYLKKIFEIITNIKCEDYYVKMAVAWAISFCFIKYYDQTLKYIKNAKLDIWTYNKAIQKTIESYRISDERKKELKKLKK